MRGVAPLLVFMLATGCLLAPPERDPRVALVQATPEPAAPRFVTLTEADAANESLRELVAALREANGHPTSFDLRVEETEAMAEALLQRWTEKYPDLPDDGYSVEYGTWRYRVSIAV